MTKIKIYTEEEIVNFVIAKLLKEKGFDEPTNRYYEHALTSKKDPETNDYTGAFGWKKGETNLASGYFKNNYGMADLSTENWYMCSAPTIAEVLMWLYEKYGIWVEAGYGFQPQGFYWLITMFKDKKSFHSETNAFQLSFNSPTDAYEAAIKHTLENLIQGGNNEQQ